MRTSQLVKHRNDHYEPVVAGDFPVSGQYIRGCGTVMTLLSYKASVGAHTVSSRTLY